MRLVDLGDVLLELSNEEGECIEFRNAVAEMEITFERIAKGELKFNKTLKSKWRDLEQRIRMKLQEKTGPFGGAENGT